VCLPLLIFPCTIKSRSSLLAPAQPGSPGKRAVKWLWWWWCHWFYHLLLQYCTTYYWAISHYYVDAACSCRQSSDCSMVCVSVCLSSVTVMSPAKMAELIKMRFWGVNLGGPKEPWIRWGPDAPMEVAILLGNTLSAWQMAG